MSSYFINQRLEIDAVWQIISICTWVVSFTERLMKACVLSNNSVIATKQGDGKGVLCLMPHHFLFYFIFSSPWSLSRFRNIDVAYPFTPCPPLCIAKFHRGAGACKIIPKVSGVPSRWRRACKDRSSGAHRCRGLLRCWFWGFDISIGRKFWSYPKART